jgi:hypothetical protein
MTMRKQALLMAVASALALGTAGVSFAQDGPGAGSPAVPPGQTTGGGAGMHRHAGGSPNTTVPPSYKNNGNETGPANH